MWFGTQLQAGCKLRPAAAACSFVFCDDGYERSIKWPVNGFVFSAVRTAAAKTLFKLMETDKHRPPITRWILFLRPRDGGRSDSMCVLLQCVMSHSGFIVSDNNRQPAALDSKPGKCIDTECDPRVFIYKKTRGVTVFCDLEENGDGRLRCSLNFFFL